MESKLNIKFEELIQRVISKIEKNSEIIQEKEDAINLTKKEFKEEYEKDLHSYVFPILKLSLEARKQSIFFENKKNELKKSIF